MKHKRVTKSQMAKRRAALIEKYWGNAEMGDPNITMSTVNFHSYQMARRDAWEHGMKVGLQAGMRLALSEGASHVD